MWGKEPQGGETGGGEEASFYTICGDGRGKGGCLGCRHESRSRCRGPGSELVSFSRNVFA